MTARPRVLHIIVGHGLRIYFNNAIASVREQAPADDLLVIDNASPDLALREDLVRWGRDPRIRLRLRASNDVAGNAKVGGLYDACNEAFAYAIEQGYDYAHLLQADMQMLWWDDDVLGHAEALFAAHAACVNIQTIALSRDAASGDQVVRLAPDGAMSLRAYGLTDTGLFHLARWRDRGVAFLDAESVHARVYAERGLVVVAHPWAPVAQIPWPAVVRAGRERGRQVRPVHRFLLEPPNAGARRAITARDFNVLEDVCVPWGWTCLTPMWPYGPESVYYLLYRYREARAHGLRRLVPRWERRGLARSARGRRPRVQRRPSATFVGAWAARELVKAVGARAGRRRRSLK